jgi:hypothetical protein
MTKTYLFFGLALIATSTAAQNTAAPYTVAEDGRGYGSLQQAVDAIGQNAGTIIIRPGSFRDCAVQTAGSIAFRAAVPGQTIFDGGACEEKGTLVLRGDNASIDGIIFQNVTVHDANGAGIRLEKGNLKVTRSIFRNSEQGILSAEDPNGSISIDQTSFSGLGRCDRGLSCAHSIYIGNYGSLSITNSRFERGNGGHYVKSRAAIINIRNNAFDDSRGKETNYMIDLPGGATGQITGNVFVQGESKENYSAFITIAPEGRTRSSAGLSINDNDASIAPGVDRNTTFVANWTDDRIALGANRLGRGLKPTDRR